MSFHSTVHNIGNNFTNATNISGSHHPEVGFLVLNVIIFVYGVATVIVYSVVLFAVVRERTIPAALRVILSNIYATSIVIMAGIFLHSIPLLLPLGGQNIEWLCRFLVLLFRVGDAARLVLLSVYAAAVLVGIRHGVEKLTIAPTIIVVSVVWLVSLGPNLTVFSSDLWQFRSIHGDGCGITSDGVGSILLTVFNAGLYGALSLIITTIITVIGIVHVKKSIAKQDIRLLKIMVKFGVLLLLANVVSFVGQAVIQFVEGFALPDLNAQHRIALIYTSYFVYLLSLLAIPLFLVIVIQTIRQWLFRRLCCFCHKISASTTVQPATS